MAWFRRLAGTLLCRILASMYYRDDVQHHVPHLHPRYQGMNAALSLADGTVLAGELPPKQLRMVQVWIELHKEELLADWELAVGGEEPFRIAPLQ